jgi:cation-transporting ATPase E
VVSGKAKARVSAVGKDSYINKLSAQAKHYKKAKSSLYSSLRLVLTILSIVAVGLVVVLYFRMSNLHQMSYEKIVTRSAGAAIGMLPAGLLLCTSVALAVGVIKLSGRHTLVQEVFSIETLARVDTLCLDKTGTITDGTMSVINTIEYKNDLKINTKQTMQAIINAQEEVNLTSKALIEKYGIGKKLKVISSIPFSSDRKYQAYQFEKGLSFYLGAPDIIIKNNYKSIKYDVEKGALEGCRVLCLAYGTKDLDINSVDLDLKPLSLILIEDTIRPDASSTIKYFEEIGVNVKVISGDNPMTVSRIAMKVGIKNAMNYISLEGLSDKEVEDCANTYQVFGRVTPEQKKILVKSIKKAGHTVAMTGDGVNDILALREADTSIAMASGSDAARNISHIVLTDSNFSALPKVVSEGRRVINNIAKVATLFLTKTIFSIILTIIGIVKGDYPIEPSQLMLIEFLIIAIPSFFLALENNPNKVSGNFIYNIFKSAIPGALVISINSIIIYVVSKYFGYGYLDGVYYGAEYVKDATSTVIAITATFSSLVVLYRVCHPFNKLRGSIFFVMCILCVLITLFVPNLLGNLPFWSFISLPSLIPLGLVEILIFIIAVLLAPVLMYLVTNIGRWIKVGFTYVFKKISDIGDDDN